jgi:antitoxin Phd
MNMVIFMKPKTKKWQLQEAKNRFSEVVRKASEEGPQTVTKHGKDSVVVLSAEDYRLLERPKTSLVEFFQTSPLSKVELDFTRDKSPSRDVEL